MINTKDEGMTLSNIGGGVAEEKFQNELQKVLDNIVDPNTSANFARVITIQIKIKPDDERCIGSINVNAKSHVAPCKDYLSACFIDKQGNKGVAREIEQKSMFTWGGKSKVVSMEKVDMRTGEVLNG